MKKYFGVLLGLLFLAGGCSWSSLNPFAEKENTVPAAESGPSFNHYLWQGALDKLGFMPKEIEDKSGGIIVTKWVKMEGSPNDLFKVEVKIYSRELRSDGLQVRVEKRQFKDGKWIDVKADKALSAGIEHQILLQARNLYRKDLLSNKG